MSASFEELDRRQTPIGELSVRRRIETSLHVEVHEIQLGDEVLMSSLFTVAEVAREQRTSPCRSRIHCSLKNPLLVLIARVDSFDTTSAEEFLYGACHAVVFMAGVGVPIISSNEPAALDLQGQESQFCQRVFVLMTAVDVDPVEQSISEIAQDVEVEADVQMDLPIHEFALE